MCCAQIENTRVDFCQHDQHALLCYPEMQVIILKIAL